MFDSHVHFDAASFRDRLDDTVERTRRAGVRGALNPAVDLRTSRALRGLQERHPWIRPCLGFHPLYLGIHSKPPEDELRELAATGAYAAFGEIGLDFWNGREDEERQRDFLECQALLAQEFGLPLSLHVRKAFYETFALLGRCGYTGSGVVHAFSGSRDMARLALDRGFFISAAATITHPRRGRLREVFRYVPRERLLVETDAPDLPPWPRRGRLHRPWDLHHTVKALAEILGLPVPEVAALTAANAERLIGRP